MRLSARYRLYLLGGLYLAPYCAMLVWCLQSAKPDFAEWKIVEYPVRVTPA